MPWIVLAIGSLLLLGPIAYWNDVKRGIEVPTGKTKAIAWMAVSAGLLSFAAYFYLVLN